MDEPDDITLLKRYTEQRSDAAFATLVARHINKVYSVAHRITGDPHHAEEITQVVFVLLARQAHRLGTHAMLAGWLYKTARLTAATWIRSEIRRTRREHEAFMDTQTNAAAPDPWPQIAPILDAAMADLTDADRHAVVLRYFDGRSMKEIADDLHTSEDAVKMRIHRAVEKLRRTFRRRGITLSAGVLTSSLASHSVQAAPAGLATSVATHAATGTTTTASASALLHRVMREMAWAQVRVPLAIAVGTVLIGVGSLTFYLLHHPNVLIEWHRHLMP